MKRCKSCKINFNTTDKYCPLCQNILVGTTSEELFPKNILYVTTSKILKLLSFSSISIIILSLFLELLLSNKIHYSIYITSGLVTNYIVVYFILKSYKNIYKLIGKYGFLVIILLLLWYFITKSTIITNYVIPSVCIFELLFNFTLVIIMRKNYLIKYSRQILASVFLLILPIILVKLNLTTDNIMSYICCLISLISIIGLLVFYFEGVKEELKKIFNV